MVIRLLGVVDCGCFIIVQIFKVTSKMHNYDYKKILNISNVRVCGHVRKNVQGLDCNEWLPRLMTYVEEIGYLV